MNKQNIENLKEFRKDVAKLIKSGKINQATFDMDHFWAANDCGTSGCLIGWSSEIYGNDPEDLASSTDHSRNRYGVDYYTEDTGTFLFSSNWKEHDNTPEGALARMDVIINEPNLFGDYEV